MLLFFICTRWFNHHYCAFHTQGGVNKFVQHQDNKFWECRESNPGLLGEKHKRDLCALPTPKNKLYL